MIHEVGRQQIGYGSVFDYTFSKVAIIWLSKANKIKFSQIVRILSFCLPGSLTLSANIRYKQFKNKVWYFRFVQNDRIFLKQKKIIFFHLIALLFGFS